MPKPKPKSKRTPKGISSKINKEYGLGPVKLPLWGWGAVALGALWFYFHFIRPSQDAGTDQGSGIASGALGGGGGGGVPGGGGGVPGRNRHHKHRRHHDRTPIRRCPRGYHRVGHRCDPNRKPRPLVTPKRTLATENRATHRRPSSGTLSGRVAGNHHR